jgi:hypothetical protein
MALPLLESVAPRISAADAASIAGAPGMTASGQPLRVAYVYVPNGANMVDWTPKTEGANFELPKILEPLSAIRSDVSVLTGLTQRSGDAGNDGAGDHARALATYLTSTRIRKTQGADIKAGVSIDQAIANRVGLYTRFPSLELGCDRAQLSGNCDSGYSCAYSFNISWKSDATPMPPEVDPKLAFERLFSTGDPNETPEAHDRRLRNRQSILDFVLEDAKRLNAKLGRNDQRKLDEYMTAVRELEHRIDMAYRSNFVVGDTLKPAGIPKKDDGKTDYTAHVRLMFDVLALAFQTDSTRVATMMMRHDGNNDAYPQIGVRESHHDLSHHGGDEVKKGKIAQINRYHMEQFAYFLQKLKATKEGNSSVLDNCVIMYGSGLADGDAHAHHNLPVLLAGRGGDTIAQGRHIRYPKDTPISNLYLSMMNRMGVRTDRFGDSNSPLLGLAG